MNSVFQGKSFLAEKDFTKQELMYLIDFAIHLKELKQKNIPHTYLAGKNIALLFEKTSTRTRSAFTVAANDLGAHPEFLGANDIQLGKKESVIDTAKVLGSMFDGIEFRGFAQETVETLAQYAEVPVWNGLIDLWHPTQMIADFMTIKEHFGHLEGLKLVYCGDGRNNVANSLLVTSALLGVNVAIVSPKNLLPSQAIVDIAQQFALESGSQLELTDEIALGVKGADILYTDVWVSMGEEAQIATRIKELLPYQVNAELVELTDNKDNLIFLHCLPAFNDLHTKTAQEVFAQFGMKEMEVTDEVLQASYAKQFLQAENRMHAIKAIMAATLGNLFIPKV